MHPVTFYRSGRTRAVLGGDFFDAVRDADGTVHAIIGDVSGHGPDEAALGALLRVSWRALVLAGVAEERLLPELQRLLVSERHDSRLFTTACTITIAGEASPSCGWPGTRRRWRCGRRPTLSAAGRAAARASVRAEWWPPLTFTLPPGWALLLYTDGLIEAREPATGDFLWIDGLLELLSRRPRHRARRAARPARRARGGLQRRPAARRRRHPRCW